MNDGIASSPFAALFLSPLTAAAAQLKWKMVLFWGELEASQYCSGSCCLCPLPPSPATVSLPPSWPSTLARRWLRASACSDNLTAIRVLDHRMPTTWPMNEIPHPFHGDPLRLSTCLPGCADKDGAMAWIWWRGPRNANLIVGQASWRVRDSRCVIESQLKGLDRFSWRGLNSLYSFRGFCFHLILRTRPTAATNCFSLIAAYPPPSFRQQINAKNALCSQWGTPTHRLGAEWFIVVCWQLLHQLGLGWLDHLRAQLMWVSGVKLVWCGRGPSVQHCLDQGNMPNEAYTISVISPWKIRYCCALAGLHHPPLWT